MARRQVEPPSQAAADWRVLDARCTVGRHLMLQEGGLRTAQDLVAEMDHFGIAEAIVLDSLARENHPQEGNVKGGAKPRRVAGRSKSAAPLEELCGS